MPHVREQSFLNEKMIKKERELVDIINHRLKEANIHLRISVVKIHSDGSISTEYTSPIDKWVKEDMQATSIVLAELKRYQSK